jgi:AraC-like DNA-binding protein/mannose-6-phosphate isomerase-like protein (cupin superfamily)
MKTTPDRDRSVHAESGKSAKTFVRRSPAGEHFRGSFPLFVNRFREGFELTIHDHDYLELVYVMAGEGFHHIGGRIERVSKGQLYVLPVGTSHVLRPGGASGANSPLVYNLCVRPDFLEEWKDRLSRHGGAPWWEMFELEPGDFLKLEDRDMRLGRIFERLHREFEAREPGYEAAMFALALDLFVRLYRAVRPGRPADSGRSRTPRDAEIRELIARIDERIAEPLSLDRLATAHGVSCRHLIRLLKRHTGMTFSEYVRNRRIELACRLLLETDLKIEAVARNAGYRDVQHFRRMFRKLTGTSPRRFREQGAR